jgi:hypothetical protein
MTQPVVGAIVDPDPKPRKSFWEEFVEEMGWKYERIAVPELLDQGVQPPLERLDILVISWDVANGSLIHRSNITRSWLQERRDRINTFLERGGILIIEAQCIKWCPDQATYDALLGSRSVVVSDKDDDWDERVQINSRMREMPLLRRLPRSIQTRARADLPAVWHPEGIATVQTMHTTNPRKLYSGRFKRHKREYIPLILDSRGKRPVLIVRPVGRGLEVVTTMYLASSRLDLILRNLVDFRDEAVITMRQSEMMTRVRRLELSVILLLVSFTVFVTATVLTIPGIASASRSQEVALRLVIALTGGMIAAGIRKAARRIFHRIRRSP